MRQLLVFGMVLCGTATALAGESAEIDADMRAFSKYVNDVSRLDGMYRGVVDYCEQFVPALIIDQSNAAWKRNNGPYIAAVDVAIERYISTRVEPKRKAEAIQQMKAYAREWFQTAHDQSELLDQVQSADNKDFACSRMLGTMSSESFHLKNMFPEDHEYWSRNLMP